MLLDSHNHCTDIWQKVDAPITRRLVDTVMDSINIWLNGLTASGYILGGRVEFLEEENPSTSIMDGNIKFHLYLTPPSPAEKSILCLNTTLSI